MKRPPAVLWDGGSAGGSLALHTAVGRVGVTHRRRPNLNDSPRMILNDPPPRELSRGRPNRREAETPRRRYRSHRCRRCVSCVGRSSPCQSSPPSSAVLTAARTSLSSSSSTSPSIASAYLLASMAATLASPITTLTCSSRSRSTINVPWSRSAAASCGSGVAVDVYAGRHSFGPAVPRSRPAS